MNIKIHISCALACLCVLFGCSSNNNDLASGEAHFTNFSSRNDTNLEKYTNLERNEESMGPIEISKDRVSIYEPYYKYSSLSHDKKYRISDGVAYMKILENYRNKPMLVLYDSRFGLGDSQVEPEKNSSTSSVDLTALGTILGSVKHGLLPGAIAGAIVGRAAVRINGIDDNKTPVYFATDRNIVGDNMDISEIFGGERGDGSLKYGISVINIPPDHSTGSIERPSIWTLTFKEKPENHVMALAAAPLSEFDFFNNVMSDTDISRSKDIILYIHGFNTSFYDALLQAGQIKYDLKFQGTMVMYSWPSSGDFDIGHLNSYTSDEAASAWSTPHFADFLKNLRDSSGAHAVHIIAHSMGNRLVSAALESLYLEEKSEKKLGHVVMAAPDVDASDFKQRSRRIVPKGSSLTIYANDNDVALSASKKISRIQRLGQSSPKPVIVENGATIDASLIKTDFLGHSYYRDNMTVISDIYELLEGKTPDRRQFLRKSADGTYWRFVRQ